MPKVFIPQAGRSLEVNSAQTILLAALAAGIPYPHGCKSGRCGSCKSRLVSGEVDLLPHTPFAPVKAVAETALAKGMGQPIRIYFGARSERDLYLLDRFAALTERHANLSFVPVLSEDSGPGFRPGYVSDAVAADLGDLDGWKAYIAGPPAMVDAAGPMLLERGVRAADIHADVFYTPEYGDRPMVTHP